jgi:TonB-dependent receptor
LLFGLPVSAATVDGRIEGRVFNPSSGTYVENARVALDGTPRFVFTDPAGEFRLDAVPSGDVPITVTFAGLPAARATVRVAAGETARRDFSLDPTAGETVQLGQFVVAATRETNAAAIALNEQRHSANLKNVVAADAYGDSTENNVAEFVKFIPGVVIDYSGPDARNISVRGMPAETTPILVDGFQVANASSSSVTRLVEVESLSMNNVARVEVTKVPTPDTPANTLGGSVNTVSKSAFERAKPLFTYRFYLGARQGDLTLDRLPAPLPEASGRRVTPNFDFSYVMPWSKTFGFTLGASHTNRYTQTHITNLIWAPLNSPGTLGTAANPMLRGYHFLDQPTMTTRTSVSASFDWKPRPRDVLSAGAQYFYGARDQAIGNLRWDVAGSSGTPPPAAWGPTFTRGSPTRGNVTMLTDVRRKTDITANANLRYRHDGPVWKLAAGASYSRSTNRYSAMENGYFDNTVVTLTNVTMAFDQIGTVRPAVITTALADGSAVDSRDASNFIIGSASNGTVRNSVDLVSNVRASAARDLGWRLPLTVKAGGDLLVQEREIGQTSPFWNFVGPDGLVRTADDAMSRYNLLDASGFSALPPSFGEPLIRWQSPQKLLQLYRERPAYFAADVTRDHISTANNSRWIRETISAGYLRADSRLLQNRLWLAGGVRYERTNDKGAGVRNDLRATYRQDANGNLIRDAAGRPIRLTTDPLQLARLQYSERGARADTTYDDFFPSLNATYSLRPDLIARLGYAHTVGRPNFNNIVPGISISDPLAAVPVITVSNSGLRPWKSRNLDLALEYYFETNGIVSFGVFRKDIADFFGVVNTSATVALLDEFGLPDDYLGYDIVTRRNVGQARVTGMEANFRKPLTFLPAWARGVQLFANATDVHLEGSTIADFSTFVRRSINWGVSLNRKQVSTNLNWNYRGRERRALITGTGVPPGTYEYVAPRLMLDLSLEVRLTRRVVIYLTGRNLTNVSTDRERYALDTPHYSRRVQTSEAGAFYSFGIKGEF